MYCSNSFSQQKPQDATREDATREDGRMHRKEGSPFHRERTIGAKYMELVIVVLIWAKDLGYKDIWNQNPVEN